MIIRISESGTVEVLETADLGRLRIEASERFGGDPGESLRSAGLGGERVGSDTYRVAASELHLMASRADDPVWEQSWTGMLGYAASRGWVDESGQWILVHAVVAQEPMP